MTDVLIDARRGAGSSLEILYGTVTWKPTLTHSRGTSIVLPAPTTYDLVDGQAVATNVQPSPDPVGGQVEWAYEVTFKDRHSKSYSFLVGVPDSTTQVNFISLPRYFETKPPLFGQGEQGVPGDAATVSVGTVTGGITAQVTNSGTNTDAVLNFVLPKGDKGDTGVGVPVGGTALQYVRKDAGNTATEWATLDKTAVGLSNVDNTSDANKPVSSAQATAISQAVTVAANTKLASDAPSTYKEGLTVTNCRTVDGWPLVEGSHPSFCRVVTHKARNLTPAIQYATAYVTTAAGGGDVNRNGMLYRTGNSGDAWGEWQTLLSKEFADTLYGTLAETKELYRSQPTISQEQKMYGSLKYNVITIHAGGKRRPGLIHKYLEGVNTSVTPTEARERYIDKVVEKCGGTIVNNASGLVHISGVPSEDGARVRLRGAQVLDGVAINPFPTDGYWTNYEAVGIMPDGELRGFSAAPGRNQTVEDMVSAGVENSFSFGPILVEGGVARDLSDPFWDTANAIVSSLNILGQKPNGDIVLINSPGKSGTSGGTLADETTIALSEGCYFAFSLDRGGSAQTWAGAAPINASSDAGGRRLIADYLYTTAPIGTPVRGQEIPLVLTGEVKAVAGYAPTLSISKDGRVQLQGRINRIDDTNFDTLVTNVALLPPFARRSANVSGVCTGQGESIRRWLQNGADGYLKILGSTGATTPYLDLSLCSWQIG